MAASIFVELESGIFTGRIHAHNGYYAGDFSAPRTVRRPAAFNGVPAVPPSLVRPGTPDAWSH